MTASTRALLVIDVQNDYFPGGGFPLWNTDQTLDNIEAAMAQARAQGVPVVLVQHVANTANGPSPFFNPDSQGVAIHPRILAAAPDAPVVVKRHADSFVGTTLEATLQRLGARELLVCGMMTQNCVTHTAISRAADQYRVSILGDCCTTVDAMIHGFALNAVATRLTVQTAAQALAAT